MFSQEQKNLANTYMTKWMINLAKESVLENEYILNYFT